MKKITVNTSKQYEIFLGENILDKLTALVGDRKTAVVSDNNVWKLHGDKIISVLGNVPVFVIPNGEKSKRFSTLEEILDFFAEAQLDRSSVVIAFGGGVVGDITGLAAALFMRGISYIQVPTTIVADVDSSIGGKCAVDLKCGKNLAGVFSQPEAVLCDISLLGTLSETEFSNGMGEVIKYGVGFDSQILDLAENARENIMEIIPLCIDIKRRIVESDEFDRGERKKLNLGHTVGHAIEKLSEYNIPHGMAVGLGLSVMCRSFIPEYADRVDGILKKNGIEVHLTYSAKELSSCALSDKKKCGNYISIIAPTSLGKCEIYETSVSELEKIISRGIE